MSFDDVFLNLYDFWNIAASQVNAATSVRYGGLYNTYFVANFVSEFTSERILKIDQFFGEVINMSRVFCFFWLTVYINKNNIVCYFVVCRSLA